MINNVLYPYTKDDREKIRSLIQNALQNALMSITDEIMFLGLDDKEMTFAIGNFSTGEKIYITLNYSLAFGKPEKEKMLPQLFERRREYEEYVTRRKEAEEKSKARREAAKAKAEKGE